MPVDPANEMEVDAGPVKSPKPRLEFLGRQLRVRALPLRRLADLHNHRQIHLIGMEGRILEVYETVMERLRSKTQLWPLCRASARRQPTSRCFETYDSCAGAGYAAIY